MVILTAFEILGKLLKIAIDKGNEKLRNVVEIWQVLCTSRGPVTNG